MKKLLNIENLCVSFGGIKALQGVSFDVEQGTITALIGPNGAGKTTVFNCVTGFYKAQSGCLEFQGKHHEVEISKLLGASFRWRQLLTPTGIKDWLRYNVFGGSHLVAQSGIARTFQNIRLFKDMTVLENLLVAQHQNVSKNVVASLLNLNSFVSKENQALQRGLDLLETFSLGEYRDRLAGELSYGLQRRLEIARALCIEPKLICLDEPAAGLNPNETAALSELILKIRQDFKVTVFVIEHDMSMVMKISDHIVVLDHGKVIARGTPADVKSNRAVISAYLGEDV